MSSIILNVHKQSALKHHAFKRVGTWVKRLDADGSKPRVMGFGLLDMHKLELILVINDEEYGVQNAWQLAVKPCKQARPNKKSPQLLATNTDLS